MKPFDFDMTYEMPAEIRQHKDVSYTVTPIGGKKELLAWREAQAIKFKERKKALEDAYQMKRSFLGDIAKGHAQGSKFVQAATLARYKAEVIMQYGNASIISDAELTGTMPLHDPKAKDEPPVVKWYETVKKALTFNL
jgi:hypothetical protein